MQSSKSPADMNNNTATATGHTSSSIPILGEGFSQSTISQDSAVNKPLVETEETEKKRRFWQLGKKKSKDNKDATTTSASTSLSLRSNQRAALPQPRTMVSPSSPGRTAVSPPRVHSPADSQIFERNVQEDSVSLVASPAIPSHIATEDHIPPVLDASATAITDDHLTPDTVEIVTHAAHLPAAVAMTGSVHAESALSSPIAEDAPQSIDGHEEQTASYAALDSADVRRLSFISFADVVHGEQAADGSMRDSLLLSGTGNIASPGLGARSPSPIRSPVSPTTSSAGFGLEASPGRRTGPGSPKSLGVSLAGTSSPNVTGEIAVDTMRQALRKAESGDLGAAARASVSAS